ncbi:anthranilate synthase component I [Bacillaceae bacterium W0354]
MINYSHQIIEGDQHTPISIFLKLTSNKKFLLESSLKHEKSGRFSFIGADPFYEMIAQDKQIELRDLYHNQNTIESGNPLEVLKTFTIDNIDLPSTIPFSAGGVGYIGYDIVKHIEHIGADLHDELKMPDLHFMFFEKVIVYDHLLQQIHLFVFDRWITNEAIDCDDELEKLAQQMNQQNNQADEPFDLSAFESNVTQDEFEKMVETVKHHIENGDIFQAVISQRLTAQFAGNPFSYYRQLRKSNPSPYMFYIDFESYQVLGASPESLIKVQDRTVTTNPIAGTRKRGNNEFEDRQLEQDLLKDEKEIAEHSMLVDLGRNDLGKICQPGTIQLSKNMVIEHYRYVMHIVSEVTGKLKYGLSSIDALTACLPAGTVSGAPKIRAMQIINELEKSKRGVYSGAIGYLGINGNFDFALTIRTMVLKDGAAHVQAGAGVVYDSIPVNEYEETLNKAKALMEV